jgi:putative protein-disulfide isomerase
MRTISVTGPIQTTLHYVHDPMCSWCWAFAPVLRSLLAGLPRGVSVNRLLGGLAPDTEAPMPEQMRTYLQSTWQRIQSRVPGTRFNFDFWTSCRPRRATYPACRAVLAARLQGEEFDPAMTRAIQHAYFLQARNPSEDATLVALADELGLDVTRFSLELNATATQAALDREIARSRALGADSFPSLVVETPAGLTPVPLDYRYSRPMLEAIISACDQRPD